ncbi:HSP20 family protein [Albidovulum inexpectatum]|uniref:HSP20 family protein n=1 Tax=Albidovulum inexpectatum TaxID=196587 RepID=A0A2S5JJ53_9RHOB|nr:Hsp20/alpha crystallin family protein [Albidovulum inexpectatum]PPB81490.1 HSP20 family protein [Albidovulum inexpectatum]
MFYPSFPRRSDPFDLMQAMLRDMDDLFGLRAETATFPAVNVWQGDEAIAITAEIPGVDIADLDISVKDNVLTISGERKPPELPEGARWHRSERSYGRFARSIRLPFAASDDRVEARLTNGVLRIVVARPEEDKPRRIEIKAA